MRLSTVKMNKLLIPLAVLMLISVSACGYHLRGAVPLPAAMQTTWVQARANTDLVRELQRKLKVSGVTLVNEKTEGAATLSVRRDRISRRILSIGSDGKAREFLLLYDVDFQLIGADDKPLRELQKVNLERSYLFDPNDVLAASQEEATLRREMYRDMADLILRRLSAQVK